MSMATVDSDAAYAAFEARDRASDGRFVVAVKTTHIYCKPSCPARRPRRENIEFFGDAAGAQAAGYRACLRCRPDEVSRDGVAVSEAIRLIEASDERVVLEELARTVGYAPHHFHRLFKRDTGLTPAAYARKLRTDRLTQRLDSGRGSVTEAIYAAGYEVPSRAYADARARMGMTPSAWKAGGAGETIRHGIVQTSLGPLLVAATEKGLCRIAFEEDADALRARFPRAEIVEGDAGFAALVRDVVAMVDDPARARSGELPLDMRGTAFQQAVWRALRAIPVGETRSYAEIAAMAGNPRAVRAAGTACGDNPLPVVVPCHRVLRGDGGIGGYAYGVERKRVLLAREAQGAEQLSDDQT
ncbi:MAG TPA: bifunctional DNA-binding transcriptional regulator/O6-methylguanine-DNA methyltransferase Ada [Sphingobium sp.]|uniref:bifunctional DNA-binding transcriptional regulator/O6-methylguanine-DNA methyltransferase Ada n=1 Tax=Sphingobium sp. TaxID=1912891 RepID=UPI002ED571D0